MSGFITNAITQFLTPNILFSSGPPDPSALVAHYQASSLATAQNAAAVSSPLQIGSVAAWYRADKGITTVAGAVTAWADQSGNGLTLVGVGSTAPTYNTTDSAFANHPSLSFDSATSQGLQTAPFTLPEPFTFVVVGYDDGVHAGYAATAGNEIWIIIGDGGQYGTEGVGSYKSGVALSANTPRIFVLTSPGTGGGNNQTFYINGTTQTAASGTASYTAATTGLQIGNGIISFKGNIAEVILFSSVLSSTQINQINCYLSNRYAIPLAQSAWADSSTTHDSNQNLAQATYANQPTLNMVDSAYNNQPTVSFSNAAHSALVSGTFANAVAQPFTVVLVGNSAGDGQDRIFLISLGSVVEMRLNQFGGTFSIYAGSDFASSTTDTSAPRIFGTIFDNTTSAIYISAKTAAATGTAGTNSLTDITLGYNADLTEGLDGKIAEVLVYSAALTQAEVNAVLAYLGTRYGIAIGS